MLPYIIFFAALVALAVSLYKDRKIERAEPSTVRALRIHHLAQGVLVALALWSAVDGERSLREARVAQLDAEAAAAGARHTAPIFEQYFFVLVPSAPTLTSYITYQRGLSGLPSQLTERFDWNNRVSAAQRLERDSGLKAFAELQRIARAVLAEQLVYGERYPRELVKWAAKTVELKEEQLPALLNNSADAPEYANLLGRGIGFSIGKLQEAQMRITK